MSGILDHSLPKVTIDTSGEATRLVRSGVFIGVASVCIFMIWASLAPIQGAVISSGVIKIDLNRKTVQHLEGGIIKEILVREGSRVEKGQTLLVLEDVSTSSQFQILTDRYLAKKAKQARLLAQKKQLDAIQLPSDLAVSDDERFNKFVSSEIELFNSKRKTYLDQVTLLDFEIQQTELELKGLAEEMQAIKAGIGFIKKQLKAANKLKKKGYIEDSQIWEQQRILSEKRERIGSLMAEEAVAKTKMNNTRIKIATLENGYIQEADDQLKETENELLELEELLKPAKFAFDRSEVIAPLAGQVINLKVNTIGGVVGSGEDLMEIVPDHKDLIVEAKIGTSDIDSVYLNQTASIQLLAFSSRSTPRLEGKVVYISEDVIEDTIERGSYHYLCHIQVNDESLATLSKDIILFPGMPITAFIQTRARTFVDFILEPMITHSRKALRED